MLLVVVVDLVMPLVVVVDLVMPFVDVVEGGDGGTAPASVIATKTRTKRRLNITACYVSVS